jgi:predicted AlkP superfamily phosphohydrolase/phosphomutase
MLIGIDSATWHVMMPLVQAGRLPNFARLMENGAYGPLKTFYPTLSPLIWATMSTGKSPDKHGMKAFTVLKLPVLTRGLYDYRWEQLTPFMKLIYRLGRVNWWKRLLLRRGWIKSVPLTANFRRCKAIWNVVGDCGRKVGFIGWWNTWPAEQVNGFMISQYLEHLLVSPDTNLMQAVYPPDLLSEARQFLRVDQRLTSDEVRRFFNVDEEETQALAVARYDSWDPEPGHRHPAFFLKQVYLRHEYRLRAGVYFYKRYLPDLFGVFFNVDAAQHFLWHCMEPQYFNDVGQEEIAKYGEVIRNWYIYLDEIIGQFLADADEETSVIVFSDHGHGPSGKLPWSGQHEDAPDGIVILSGRAVKSGVILEGASVYDITPTALALMGLPVAEDMDGRALVEALAPEFLAQYPLRTVKTFETGEVGEQVVVESEVDEVVKARLRDLGYIE